MDRNKLSWRGVVGRRSGYGVGMHKPPQPPRDALTRAADWYIERIDYGRPNVWAPMYWLYKLANRYIHGR